MSRDAPRPGDTMLHYVGRGILDAPLSCRKLRGHDKSCPYAWPLLPTKPKTAAEYRGPNLGHGAPWPSLRIRVHFALIKYRYHYSEDICPRQ